MKRKQKNNLLRVIISFTIFMILMVINYFKPLDKVFSLYGFLLPFFLYLALYLYISYDVLIKAFKNISHGEVFDENFLMLIATIGAFVISQYSEAIAVMLFYQIGELFQSMAVQKSRKSISSLMDIRPDYANLVVDNCITKVDPEEVNISDIIQVMPGEKIPLDGIIIEGNTSIDTSKLTGESLPSDLMVGDKVISGTINLTRTINVKVTKTFGESTVSKILDLVENAEANKSKSETFITKFARYYTPSVVFLAVLLALIPSLVTKDYQTWIYRALSFLVVSCPCALVISVPLSFFAGIGASSRYGVLVKGSNYLDVFNKANIFVFDKTGTLTKGNFAVLEVMPQDRREEILCLASTAEQESNHPIALSIIREYGKDVSKNYHIENFAGRGIKAVGDDIILCGNHKLMDEFNIKYPQNSGIGSLVYVAKNNEYIGSILIADEIKPEAKELIKYLNNNKAKTIMLTGDNEKVASYVSSNLGLSSYKASMLPQDKVTEVKNLLKTKGEKDKLCFIGDGINDAPVLMQSDVGIAMGALGSDAAIEAADIVLMNDDLSKIKTAKKIAKKTLIIVYENIIFAIGIKMLVLILSALGYANMWLAVFADVGVAVLAILNAMRANTNVKE